MFSAYVVCAPLSKGSRAFLSETFPRSGVLDAFVIRVFSCLIIILSPLPALLGQTSYRVSTAMNSHLTGRTQQKQQQPEAVPASRFRGWKHTARGFKGIVSHSALSLANPVTAQISNVELTQPLLSPKLSSFALRPTLPAGDIPTAVAMGDFNGDGHLDWAISNGGDSTIWIYLGNGDGTAKLPTILHLTGAGPTWITAVDLRGVGKLDLIVSEADSQTVGVLLGNGDGTFQSEAEYVVPAPPLFVLSTDFTGDGKLDIAVGMMGTAATGPVAVLPGDGAGHLGSALFTPADMASVGAWLATADFNGDGKPDLVVIDPDDIATPHAGAQIYLNAGTGTFTAGQLFYLNSTPPGEPPLVALAAAAADLNGDGCQDAVVTDALGIAWVYTGNCDGTVKVPAFSSTAVGDLGVSAQLADVNEDGKLDLVVGGAPLSGYGGAGIGSVAGDDLCILLGDGAGHFSSARVFRGDPSIFGFGVGDLNGDGFPDVVAANQTSNSADIFLNDGSGGFGDPQGETMGYNSGNVNAPLSPFLFADLDGNGTKDIVVLESPPLYPGAIEITTLLNDGTGRFGQPIQSPAWDEGPIAGDFVLADFRNTGHPDLLVVGLAPPFLYFAPNIGGGKFGASSLLTTANAAGLLAVADFNGDGKLDFVSLLGDDFDSYLHAAHANIFLGNGDGTFISGQSLTFGSDPNASAQAVFVGDFNRDGKLDILAITDGAYEFLGNGDGTFQPVRLLFPNFGPVAMADVNQDGWPDLIAMSDQFGDTATFIPTISIFLGQPDGSFQFSQTYNPYLDFLHLDNIFGTDFSDKSFEGLVGDFNGDGVPDMALFQYTDVTYPNTFVQIMYGNGDGTFTPSYVSYPLNKAFLPQFAADVNGDGLADLIEMDNLNSSFNVIKSTSNASAIQLQILTNPVTSTTGWGRVVLNVVSTSPTSVSLAASDAHITVPSVTIPAGNVSQDFQFTIGSGFNVNDVFSLTAQVGTSTSTAYASISSVAMPIVEMQPTALLFGDVDIAAATQPQSFTLKNIGTANLTPTFSAGTYFSETDNCGSSVVPGGSCTIQVTGKAPQMGVTAGGLSLVDTNFGIVENFPLEAIGRGLQIEPCCLLFVSTTVSGAPQQTVTLTNQETVPLTITSQLYPPGQGFNETNNCGTLAPGGTCQFTVSFSSSQSGIATDSINITDSNAIDNTYAISLYAQVSPAADFALSSDSGSATVSPGQTATYNFTLSSLDNFAGSVALSCSGAPTASTCNVTPNSLSIAASGSANFSVDLATTAPASAQFSTGTIAEPPQAYVSIWLTIEIGLFIVITWLRHRRRRLAVCVLGLLALLTSCGGGGGGANSSNGGSGPKSGGTPSGTYVLTITGTSSGLSHSQTVSLTVN